MEFNVMKYLEGRKQALKAKAWIAQREAPGSIPERCAQARVSEVCELLYILENLEGNDV